METTGKQLYAKICHEEGVVFEKKYETEAEAQAFVDGFNATIEALDIEDDGHFACTHDTEAVDADEQVKDVIRRVKTSPLTPLEQDEVEDTAG